VPDLIDNLLAIEKINDNRYKVTYHGPIYEVDTLGNLLTSSHLPPGDQGNKPAQSWNLSFTQNQNYIFNDQCLYDKEGRIQKYFNDTFLKKNALRIVYQNSLSYFFATSNGIILNNNLRILQGFNTGCITQDKAGNYWVTTLGSGVFVFDKFFMNTHSYKDAYKGKVQYTYALNGHIFFTAKDNNLYELYAGKVTPVFNFNSYISEESRLANSYVFQIDGNFQFVYADRKGGVIIDNLLNHPYSFRRYDLNLLSSNKFNSALRVGNSLYINANNRILSIDLPLKYQGGLLKSAVLSDSVRNEKIFGFARAADNSIWYSTLNHVYKVEYGKGVIKSLFNKNPFVYFDFCGDYLVGYTTNNNLYVCRNYNEHVKFEVIQGQNCLWDKFYKLDTNHLLITTNNAYRLLTLSTLTVSVIDNPFIPKQADAITSDGEFIYFFKNGSITSVELSRLFMPTEPPKIFYTYLHAGNKSYRIQRDLTIKFQEAKNISIDFSTLSLSGKEVSYFYSVSKGEDNWQPVSGEQLNLLNPASGYYYIKVKAKTVSSGFSSPVVFTLYIDQPVWMSWWFITLCVWAFIALIAGLMRYRLMVILKNREKAYQTEIKFMKSEYKAMNALMNPHFIFNTLNNVQSLVNANDKVAANEYLRIFADLIRQNMHNISKEMIPLQKEVDLVGNYLSLEKLRFEDKLTYNIIIEDNLDLTEIMVPPLLIQPLVENSIKHGILPLRNKQGIIIVEIGEKGNDLYIEVKDNGVGMGHKKQGENPLHESYGLGNIRKRIEQMGIMQNKKITFTIEEKLGKPDLQTWTVVSIVIPNV
jgi:two-component sensor histidine kinase